MKNLINNALILLSALIIQSCASTRSGTSADPVINENPAPVGTVTPAAGSAADVASGRNTVGVPLSTNGAANVGSTTATVNSTTASGMAGSGDAGMASTVTTGSTQAPSKMEDYTSQQNGPQQFIIEAALSGHAEVQLSEVALSKAQNPAVKSFASMMVKDHSGANAELKSLAAAKSVTLSQTTMTSTNSVNQNATGQSSMNQNSNESANNASSMDINQKINRLKGFSGNQFDIKYMEMMIADHERSVSLFEQAAQSSDPEVKAYATKYLPTLKAHLQNVTSLNSKLANGATPTAN